MVSPVVPFTGQKAIFVQSSGPHHRLWHAVLLSLFYIHGSGDGFNQNLAEQKWQDWIWGGALAPSALDSYFQHE